MTEITAQNAAFIEDRRKKLIGKVLFLSNYFFLTFLGRHFLTAQHDRTTYVLANIGTLLVALILTTLMNRLLSQKACLIAIPAMLGLAVLAAYL